MRPGSIILFERIYLVMVVLGVVNAVMAWDRSVAEIAAQPGLAAAAPYAMAAVVGFSTLLYLLLWYFIARRASRVAKWIYVVLVGISLASIVLQVAGGRLGIDAAALVGLLVLALMLWSAALLFKPDVVRWLAANGGEPGRDVFG